MTKLPVVMGIDPGYDRIGWAVGTKNKLLGSGCIQTNKKNTTTERYLTIQAEITSVLATFQPDEVALESVFFTNNQKTAMQIAEARGLLIGCCLAQTQLIFNYTPPQIKSAVTGNGAATKDAVARMVALQLKIDTKSMVDDAVDAIAIMMTHLASRSMVYLQS